MKTAEMYQTLMSVLRPIYQESEARSIALLVLGKRFGLSQTDVYLDKDSDFSGNDNENLQNICQRLSQGEPVQYVLGTADFGGLSFVVNRDVLIPRPETLTLVQASLIQLNGTEQPHILDVGTGSGCIAIALQYYLNNKACVTAWDISEAAWRVARENAERIGTDVRFVHADVLQCCDNASEERYHLIVSNPPYVRELEKTEMHCNVLEYEPHTALFVSDEDPLLFYRALASLGKNSLLPGGSIVCEMNENLPDETEKLFIDFGYKCMKTTDEMGKNRIIIATL